MNLGAIGKTIHIDLNCAAEKAVNQYGILTRDLDRVFHVSAELRRLMHDFHRPATQHIGRADHNGITNITRHGLCFFNSEGCTICRLA